MLAAAIPRTATPMANPAKWRYLAARGEFEPLFLNGAQRSVNRKVQGSNPCSGAKSEFKFSPNTWRRAIKCSNGAATVQQLDVNTSHRCGPKTGFEHATQLGGTRPDALLIELVPQTAARRYAGALRSIGTGRTRERLTTYAAPQTMQCKGSDQSLATLTGS